MNATVRRNKGTDIDAACGQLAARAAATRRPPRTNNRWPSPPPVAGERHPAAAAGGRRLRRGRGPGADPAGGGLPHRRAPTSSRATWSWRRSTWPPPSSTPTAATPTTSSTPSSTSSDPRFDTVARAASPNAMRAAGLLTGSRIFLDSPVAPVRPPGARRRPGRRRVGRGPTTPPPSTSGTPCWPSTPSPPTPSCRPSSASDPPSCGHMDAAGVHRPGGPRPEVARADGRPGRVGARPPGGGPGRALGSGPADRGAAGRAGRAWWDWRR